MQDALLPIGGARDVVTGIRGQFFTALNPTPGTGIAGHAAPTTFDATKPILLAYNDKDSGVLLVPQFLRMQLTAASVGNTVQRFSQVIDPGSATLGSRYASGGTELIPRNVNMLAKTPNRSKVHFGAVVAAAANGGAATVGNTTYRSVLGVVADTYQLTWGCPIMGDPASLITTGTAVSHVAFGYGPVVIGPGGSFLVHQWAASQSAAPSFEVEFGFLEIPISA